LELKSRLIVRALLGASFVVAIFFMQATAYAEVQLEVLEIQYTGLDVSYDGSAISTTGDVDPLESVDFLVDGSKVLGLNAPGDTPLSMALSIPNVNNIPVGGGSVTSSAGGTLSLTLPAGDYLNLELDQIEVKYIAVTSVQLHFMLAAGAGEVLSQLLPIGKDYADIVAVSLSTNIDYSTLTDNGNFVTGFVANGTGEIEGYLVPEAGSIALLLCGLTGLICWRRR
jgi:hypothetical protein